MRGSTKDVIRLIFNIINRLQNHEYRIGGDMLEVTEKASERIKDVLKNHKNPPAIRILIQGG